ncbi:MAG: prevent-host-death family protein [Candidatus Doudnabacteria bacterium RIFCSPHIGHO2_12_FULL_48_11]|uniref:Antitoxin n=1 Tax=Candidatus Doudnabacteria bacterium RIFCSPHIGHO2_01_FULL_46_24 TaxID=1817825 RepID=A0A1F5NST6_9BACT|nr:MAG: prevent-host-death family protein [Candidatus Doudnabacteria bacterium RIFCSPHIGHO2_01_FULL_46_24]OGE94015.1 MAG: prevent-host-death family protein [Candidatus Doudnabacteria bacterium RIFCSPHIGHO2_12_FULL_48_11]
MPNVISALTARNKFGQILKQVEKDRRSFVVEKRGSPKAVILSIMDYLKSRAPEPEILRVIGEESKRNKTSRISMKRINAIITEVRRSKK